MRYDDRFLVCADFDAYWDAQERVEQLWRKPSRWWKASMLNTARVGWFLRFHRQMIAGIGGR